LRKVAGNPWKVAKGTGPVTESPTFFSEEAKRAMPGKGGIQESKNHVNLLSAGLIGIAAVCPRIQSQIFLPVEVLPKTFPPMEVLSKISPWQVWSKIFLYSDWWRIFFKRGRSPYEEID
jgi:hypothetical protein